MLLLPSCLTEQYTPTWVPARQLFLVTRTPAAETPPGPPRAARFGSPTSRGGAIQLRPAPGCPGAHRAEGREALAGAAAAAGAGGGHSAPCGIVSKIRPLRASRKQLMRPRLRARHADGWPMGSGAPRPGLGGCQGQSRMYAPSLGNIARGRAKLRPPPEAQSGRPALNWDSTPKAGSGSARQSPRPLGSPRGRGRQSDFCLLLSGRVEKEEEEGRRWTGDFTSD